jgi:hypothetical protein
MKNLIFVLGLFLSPYLIESQTIEKFSIDSGGASATAGGIEILYTIGEVAIQELDAGTIQLSEGFINADFKVKIDPKLFLQGPIINPAVAGLMNDNLRQGGHIPTTSPYADAATCNASVFTVTGTDAIVDWVWVELRAENNSTKLINGKSALLQRDGDIVGLDGVTNLIMQASPTNYFVVVKHRNHLGAMSAAVVALNKTTATVVDFKSNALTTYGTNARATLSSGSMALWAGDVNGNGQVRYLGPGNDTNIIKDAVLGHAENGTNSNYYPFTGYYNADINMNGQVRYLGPGNDTNTLKDIVLSHPANGTFSNYFPFNVQITN